MALTWITTAGMLGVLKQRNLTTVSLSASTDSGNSISYQLISGELPRGMRLVNNTIYGSPVEQVRYTVSRFVIRASDGVDSKDRTFSLAVDGNDIPQWITASGFLNVGPGHAYYILDNSYVDFQLQVEDAAIVAGAVLTFYLMPNSGTLPPGLTLSSSGRISGFTDPVLSVIYSSDVSGAYDAYPYDETPIDFATSKSTGFDSYLFDNTTWDYASSTQVPKHLSRIYTFGVAVTDGQVTVNRIFKIYVVTEEFLKADNTLLDVDTSLFQADASNYRVPVWITPSYLGEFRSNNYLTIFLEVYHPSTLSGYLTYFVVANNPDGSPSTLPPGMTLDQIRGEIAGKVPYQPKSKVTYTFTMQAVNFLNTTASQDYNLVGDWSSAINYYPANTVHTVNNQSTTLADAVRFQGFIWVCLKANINTLPVEGDYWSRGTSSSEKTFTIDIIGNISSIVTWVTDSNLGSVVPNQASSVSVEANSSLYGGRVSYEIISGSLPPGLTFLPNGFIEGKVKQFADASSSGLTRFYDVTPGTGEHTFNTTFDGTLATFDRSFTFTVRAQDSAKFSFADKTFTLSVSSNVTDTYSNLFFKAFQTKDKRLAWFNFITDAGIFTPDSLYRPGDTNFGIQTEMKMLVFAGIKTLSAVSYVQAMSRNHYRKRMKFGNVKMAKGKDPNTQQTLYEVLYVELLDDLEKNGVSISQTVHLPTNINSVIDVSYDSIKIDSNIPLSSDPDHERIFPNSIENMRSQISDLATAATDIDRSFLPLWMRSIQDQSSYELGYTKALVLCYLIPGTSAAIMANINEKIRNEGFSFKSFDFTVDRYIIDIVDGQIQDKYLVFPQRGEKLP
jgi:Putative Ig domain